MVLPILTKCDRRATIGSISVLKKIAPRSTNCQAMDKQLSKWVQHVKCQGWDSFHLKKLNLRP